MIRPSDAAIRGEERRNIRIRNANGASQAVHWQCTRVDESANGYASGEGRLAEVSFWVKS